MTGWEKILIAVDESETSRRAVEYAGAIAPGIANVRICLLHVYPEPPPDYYTQGGRLDTYRGGREERGGKMLKEAADLLAAAGDGECLVKSAWFNNL